MPGNVVVVTDSSGRSEAIMPRCRDCRDANGRKVRHGERIVRKERLATGSVGYHLECECGETWWVSVLVEPAIADALMEGVSP